MYSRSPTIFVFLLLSQIFFLNTAIAGSAESNAATIHELKVKTYGAHDFKMMLYLQKFEELDTVLDNLFKQYEKHPTNERALILSYRAFKDLPENANQEHMEANLNTWVNQTQSARAYTARGIFFNQLASLSRGGKYANKTPSINFVEMREFNELAMKDLQIALKKQPNLLPASETIMQIALTEGLSDMGRDTYQAAIKLAPNSYWLRTQHMVSFEPRWGGSYTLMQKYITETIKAEPLNPKIHVFRGSVFAEKGRMALHDDDFATGLSNYNAALEFGDRLDWLKNRAFANYMLNNYDASIKDIERILTYQPGHQTATYVIEQIRLDQLAAPGSNKSLTWGYFNFET